MAVAKRARISPSSAPGWMCEAGVELHPALRFNQDGTRAVTLAEDVAADTVLLSIPLSLVFSPSVVSSSSIVIAMRADGSAPLPPRHALYAAMVQHGADETSPWYAYLHDLPDDCDLPSQWPAGEAAYLLQGTNLGGAVDATAAQARAEAEQAAVRAAAAASRAGLSPFLFTTEAFARCRALVHSRAFTEKVLEPGTLQAPGVPGGGAGCLLPALDMLNHHHDAAMLWRNDSNRLAFVTPRALSSGTQVYNNYGAKGNEELLAGYGFCLPDNPHDTLALQLRWPHAVFPPRAAAFLAGAIAGANAAAAHASAQASGVLREESQHAEGSSPITSEESQHAEGSSSTTIALASEPQPRLRFTLRGVGEDLAGTVPQVATLLLPSDTVAGWTRHSEFAATDLLTVSEQLSALAQLRHRFETSAATTAMPLQGEAFVVPEARSRAAALYRASQARVAERLTALATTQALTTVKTLAAADRTYKGPTLGTIASRMASGESTQLRLSTLATQRQVAAVLAAFVGLDADLLLALVLCMREEALGSYGNTVRSLNVSIDTQINNNITDSPLPWPRSTALPVPHVPPIARTRWRQWQQAQETSLSDLLAPEVCAMLLATGCFDPSRLTRAAVERRLWYVHSRGVATPDGELCLISALDDVPRHAVATLEMHTDAESDALVLTCFGRPLADVVDDVTTASLPAVLPLADMAGIPWDTGAMVLAHAAIPWGVCSGGIQTWAVVADEATSRAQVETGTNDACSTTAGGVAADSATVVTPSDCEDSEVAATTGVEPAAAATKVVTRGANADSTAEAGSLQTTEGAEDSEAADSSEDEAFLQIFIGNTRRTLCALQSDIQADCWQHLRQVMEDDTAAADAHAARNPSDALAVNCAALAALAKAEMEIVLRARGVCASGGD